MSEFSKIINSILDALEKSGHAEFIKGDPLCQQIWEVGKFWISFSPESLDCIGLNEKDEEDGWIVLWTKEKGGE